MNQKSVRAVFHCRYETVSNEKIIVSHYLGFDNESQDEKRRYPLEKEKKILPLRPIILGGDDLTFVCDGKLGLYLSKCFIEAFEKQKEVSDGGKLTACAGVAITKTKYPFYRGYQLAEELCSNAKKKRSEQEDNHSYIDFHISAGGFTGGLCEIRHKYFWGAEGDLLFRPYKLAPADSRDGISFDLFVKNAGKLRQFPNNKIKELRQILTLSREATEQFVKEMEYRGRNFPNVPGGAYEKFLFDNSKTPYFDLIELLEFYPSFIWSGDGGEQ